MEPAPVNWETLDALVVDFAKSESLIEDPVPCSSSSSSQFTSSSSDYRLRLIIRQIRRLLEVGDVHASIDLLREHAPVVLEDSRIVFQLQKQKFVELLRRGTSDDRDSAISCLRGVLAPCALDAYPEAYEEFKHILLTLIYDKDDQNSPVTNEWSEKKRDNIAGMVSSVLRAHFKTFDPVFSMTLRYLISIHKGFCLHEGIQSPIADLSETLLLDERDPPAIPKEHLFEAPPFDEVDIQALAHAVSLTRQEAVDSLKFTEGDIYQAFQNELCRMKLDASFLDELIYEYCVYRGIVESGVTSAGSLNQSDSCCSSRNCSTEMDCETSKKISDCDASPSSILINGSSDQCTEDELQCPCERAGSGEDCSTSMTHSECLSGRRAYKRHLAVETGRRKRWRGRNEKDSFPRFFCSNIAKGDDMANKKSASETLNDSVNNKYEKLLHVTDLAYRGLPMDVIEEVNSIDSNFFVQNPVLLFRVKQVEFLKYVSSGDHSSAIKVACSYLGPLAANTPSLLKHLKETLLALLRPSEDALQSAPPLCALATSLQIAIGQHLEIDEPRLMKIMKVTLRAHADWFKLQMCRDRFENLLIIDSLKDQSAQLLLGSDPLSEMNSGNHICPNVSISANREPGSSPGQVSSTEVASDENAILKVMEFLALPRPDAIQLLAQYDGNAEDVIQQIFA